MKKLLDHIIVDDLGTIELGNKKPDEESETKPVQVGDEVEDETKEGLGNLKGTIDHPVGEPLLVILISGACDCSDRVNCWVEHSNGYH